MYHGKKNLLVDDDDDFVTITKSHLQKAGFDVVVAYNGKEGIGKARTEGPDIILLDVVMPDQDGFDVCERLKRDENTRIIPVIMMTSQVRDTCNSMYKGREYLVAEADDYMRKPMDYSKLLKSISDLINTFDKTTHMKAIGTSPYLKRKLW